MTTAQRPPEVPLDQAPWQAAFKLAPNVRFTRTPESAIPKRTRNELSPLAPEERKPAAESRLVEPLDMAKPQAAAETLAPELLVNALQGAALGVKLARLDEWNTARRRIANNYGQHLSGDLVPPAGPFGADHVAHVYAIRVRRRDELRQSLEQAGVMTNIHYPRPVHMQPAYAGLGYEAGDFPVSEALAAEFLSLPLYPELGIADQRRVIGAVNAATGASHSKVA